MMVIKNNFYNQLNKIVNNEERYFANFVFWLRYFAHDVTNRHTHTHINTCAFSHTHLHINTHTYTEHEL